MLPGGSDRISDEGHVVYEVLTLCENTRAEIERERADRQRADLEAAQKKAKAKNHGGRY